MKPWQKCGPPSTFRNLKLIARKRGNQLSQNRSRFQAMRALLQRVSRASVSVNGQVISEIGHGLVILLGVGHGDGAEQAAFLADKISHLRIFEDANGKTNLSVLDVAGEAMVVSQFTLYADASNGRRPSFTDAASPSIAEPLVTGFAELLRGYGISVRQGAFGEHMLVDIRNDGPVTIWLER